MVAGEQASARPEPPLYFVCYARAERDLVSKVEAKLAARRRRGELELWRDLRNLDVWEEFTPEILDALRRASGAIVVVSDSWYASDYIQTHEWPTILDRNGRDPTFAVFPLAVTQLDKDDPLRTHNFVNDLRDELLLGCTDAVRDAIFTRLSDRIGDHVRSITGQRSSALTAPAPTPPIPPAPPPAGSADLRPGLHKVPELPDAFVAPAELAEVCELVIGGKLTGISGLRGEGGTGKSVLAAAVARRLVDDLPGGVHWVTVGEHATSEDVSRLQADLLSSLGSPPAGALRDHNQGKELLRASLAMRPALVVLDDVWHPWQGRAFDAVEPGGPARLLFTTRFSEALPPGTATAELPRLSLAEATALLGRLPAGLPPVAEHLVAVLEAAGGLRLALFVLAATAQAEGSWGLVVARLHGLAERFGSGDDASSAHKALHVAVGTLDPADADRFWTLGAFPADASLPIALLAALWDIPRPAAGDLARRLAAKGLLASGPETMELHDHVHDFLQLESPVRASVVHLQLYELARERAGAGWQALAEDEPYLWDRLVWHATRAGLNSEALRDLVTDVEWLVRRIRGDGASTTEQDLRRVCEVTAQGHDAPLRRLQRVLRHGDLFDTIEPDAGLQLSLACWTSAVGIEPRGRRRLRAGSLPVPAAALLRTLRGHAGEVRDVAFAPDGRRIATASRDGTARIWDPDTGETLSILAGQAGQLWGVAFSPDGRRLATTGTGGAVRIWDPLTGATLATLVGHTDWVYGVAFSPDGRQIVTAGADATARIWDPDDGAVLATLTGHLGVVCDVELSSDGQQLATAGIDRTARIWDPRTGAWRTTLTGHTDAVWRVAFAPDGRRVATASEDRTVRIWDPAGGEAVLTLEGHTDEVYGAAFSPDGRRLATASWDGTARIWDPGTGETLTTLTGHTDGVYSVAFSPDGRRLATASTDGTARIWDPDTGEVLPTVTGHTAEVYGLAFTADGRRLATASKDRTARIWDPDTSETVTTLTGHTAEVYGVTLTADGRRAATASADGTARIWDAGTGATLTTLTSHAGALWSVAFTLDGRWVATAGADGTARLWDPDTGIPRTTLTGHRADVTGVAFSPDGRRVATTSRDGTACIWDPDRAAPLVTLDGHRDEVHGVAFSPDGRRLATASADRTARLWDPDTGAALITLTGHTNVVWRVAFAPDGRRLATASTDGTARIWDLTTGECLLTLALACSGAIAWCGDSFAVAAGWHWAIIRLDPG